MNGWDNVPAVFVRLGASIGPAVRNAGSSEAFHRDRLLESVRLRMVDGTLPNCSIARPTLLFESSPMCRWNRPHVCAASADSMAAARPIRPNAFLKHPRDPKPPASQKVQRKTLPPILNPMTPQRRKTKPLKGKVACQTVPPA